MIYLIISIFCTSALFWIFRWHSTKGYNQLTLITVNYFVAGLVCSLYTYENLELENLFNNPWTFACIALGLSFVFSFLIIAKSTVETGVSLTAMASKLSLILTVLLSFILLDENMSWRQSFALLLALLAIYISNKSDANTKHSKLPWLVFLLSALVDFLLGYFSKKSGLDSATISSLIFCAAAISGIIYSLIIGNRIIIIDVLFGVFLGLVNAVSIFTFLQAFKTEHSSALLFICFSVGILLVSTLGSIILFKEKISLRKRIGILLSIVSIFLLYNYA